MGLFYKEPTSNEKREINAIISRVGTCFKRLESANSIDKYFTEYDKFISDYNMLREYEKRRIKFNVPLTKIYNEVVAEIPRLERDIVARGYDRMQRDAVKLTTEKSKQNKAKKFFDELEYYYPKLQPATVIYIKSLRANSDLGQEEQSENVSGDSKITAHNFCAKCGSRLQPGSLFCGNCGTKV